MDCSLEYIEMCRKADEIQSLKMIQKYIKGKSFYHPEHDRGMFLINSVWLPRQDQLQDMVEVVGAPNPPGAWTLNSVFTAFLNIKNTYSPIEKSKMSMEQLWLAFVMSEKFNKKWDGKEWISVTEV